MQPSKITLLLLISFCLITGMKDAPREVHPKQSAFNSFFIKRSFVLSSISELEVKLNTKFSSFQKFKIKQAKKKIAKELKKADLLEECDVIILKNGEEIQAQVMEVGPQEIKYKKCENKSGPTYILKRSEVFMVKYANGSKDFFGNEKPVVSDQNEIVNSEKAVVDTYAILSLASVVTGFLLLIASGFGIFLLIAGIVFGFVSRSRIKKSKGKLKGDGMALAGIITGFVILGLLALLIAVLIAAWA